MSPIQTAKATTDAILYALIGTTPDIGMTGQELRKRLKFAGFDFINAAVFYGTLKDLKQEARIGGGMINRKRCYWLV